MQKLIEQLLATSPWEAAAALIGLAYLLLAVRRNLLCWLCAFVSTTIYVVLFAQAVSYYSFKQPLSLHEFGGIVLIVIGVGLLVAL